MSKTLEHAKKLVASKGQLSSDPLAFDYAVALLESAAYAGQLEVALVHVTDSSDYDPEVCPQCAGAKALLDAIYAKRIKGAVQPDGSYAITVSPNGAVEDMNALSIQSPEVK